MNLAQLFRLLSWLSPAFPVGSYSYSHGLEFAVYENLVRDESTLAEWLEGIIRYGTGRMDAAIFAAVYRASSCDLKSLIQMAIALKGTSEFSRESLLQGRSFQATLESSWLPSEPGELLSLNGKDEEPLPYVVAVALACQQHEIPLTSGLGAYLHAFVANLVSAGIRLIPLGHTAGQAVLARMEAPIKAVVCEAMQIPVEDWGTATPMVDWTSMQHEVQHTRLFRS